MTLSRYGRVGWALGCDRSNLALGHEQEVVVECKHCPRHSFAYWGSGGIGVGRFDATDVSAGVVGVPTPVERALLGGAGCAECSFEHTGVVGASCASCLSEGRVVVEDATP